jgi:hypothetical protein
MTPPPVALGLMLCEQVLVDHRTRNPTPISISTGLAVSSFPSEPQRFSLFAALTNGRGDAILRLIASRLDTGEPIYEYEHPLQIRDPLLIVNASIRLRRIVVPAPGLYEFVLLIDKDPIAQRTLRVYHV